MMFCFVIFSPDGNWLAARSEEGQINLWRAPSWAEIAVAEAKEKKTQTR
jgi:WD40 repeat protein